MSRYIGKHMQKSSEKKMKTKRKNMKERNVKLKFKLINNIIIILLIGIISGTSAYIILKNKVINEFAVGVIKTEIFETSNEENIIKNDVYIKNTGNIPIYLRVAIIISWKDEEGKIVGIKPEENIDYLINYSTSTNWLKSSEGYYYYKNAISVNDVTDILLEKCTQIKNYEDRVLEVNIATQAIQAEPHQAVIDAWNVDVIDGALVLKE